MPNIIEGDAAAEPGRFAIVVSRYNEAITGRLLEGAVGTLTGAGVADQAIDVAWVPGAWEIPLVAHRLAHSRRYAAVLCLGAVIRGETSHDQHINRQVSLSLGRIALEAELPVLFGVLTCNTLEQAIHRAGGNVGNKGSECAQAALEMTRLLAQIPSDMPSGPGAREGGIRRTERQMSAAVPERGEPPLVVQPVPAAGGTAARVTGTPAGVVGAPAAAGETALSGTPNVPRPPLRTRSAGPLSRRQLPSAKQNSPAPAAELASPPARSRERSPRPIRKTRRARARAVALQVLYEDDLNPRRNLAASDRFIQQRLRNDLERVPFAQQLVRGVRLHREQIDRMLVEKLDHWSLPRLAVTDRNVLRLGTYELVLGGTPAAVAINEAVELARRFGSGDSASFVNGVLDRIAKTYARRETSQEK